MRRRAVRLLVGTGLVAGSTLVGVPAAIAAATCDGLPVTLTVTALAGSYEATSGDDVISVEPASGSTGLPAPGPAPLAVFGDGGDDTICLASAEVDVYGGSGSDTIISTTDSHQSPFGGGAVLDGGPGDDVIQGGDIAEHIYGDSGDDQLSGGEGRNTFHEGAGPVGDDVVVGGDGVDIVDFGELDHGITLDLASGASSGFGTDTFSGIEAYTGTPYDDTMLGGPGDDDLEGGVGGDDTIDGGPGNDFLVGSRLLSNLGVSRLSGDGGNDTLTAYAGTAVGGPGNDSAIVRGPAQVRLGAGADSAFVSYENARAPGSRVVTGGPGDDRFEILGGSRTRTIFRGGAGRDRLRLLGQRHQITLDVATGVASYPGRALWFSFTGFEWLIGSSQPDVLLGGPGADRLDGSGGNDVIRGRGGADVLIGAQGRDTAYGGPGHDVCDAEVRHGCEARG